MKRFAILLSLLTSLLVVSCADRAEAGWRDRADRNAAYHASLRAWNQPYYSPTWGRPLAMVAPPTARMETNWGWGVTQTTVSPIYHQFERPYPGDVTGDAAELYPTPLWPSHTHQFGVNYIRGPW